MIEIVDKCLDCYLFKIVREEHLILKQQWEK